MTHSLVKAYEDLNIYIENEHELKATKEYQAAADILKLAKEQIDKD